MPTIYPTEFKVRTIRLSGYLSNVPVRKKLATLEQLYNQPDNPYSVHALCDALGAAWGTFTSHAIHYLNLTAG